MKRFIPAALVGIGMVLAAVLTPASAFGAAALKDRPNIGVELAAVGDVCDPDPLAFAGVGCRGTANTILRQNPDAVVVLGDLQYPDFGSAATYQEEWGQLGAPTYPVLGNHDKRSPLSETAFNVFFGSDTTYEASGYQYAVDLGAWTLIVLNSNGRVSDSDVAQFDVLLDGAGNDNVVVAWHHPRWSSPCSGCHGSIDFVQPFYDVAVRRGVDLVLGAHDHRYERFAPMDGDGPADDGVREFVLGMGGAHPDPDDGGSIRGSELVKGDFVGVGFFTLSANSYSWSIAETTSPTGVSVVVDSGTQAVR